MLSPILYLLALCGLVALIRQIVNRSFKSTYTYCENTFASCRMIGREAAQFLLDGFAPHTITVEEGATIDHFDMWRNCVKLRTQTSVSASVAALAIAAHEVGHAAQFVEKSLVAMLTRCAHIGLVLGAAVAVPLTFLGLQRGWDAPLPLLLFGSAFAILRCPIVLWLESDASRRAMSMLRQRELCCPSELAQVSRFLHAAFRTHASVNAGVIVFVCSASVLYWTLGSESAYPVMDRVVFAPHAYESPVIQAVELSKQMQRELWQLGLLNLGAVALVLWAWRARSLAQAVDQDAAALNNAGLAQYHKGDYATALTLIDRAIERDPLLPAGHYNRAVILSSLGETERALLSIERMFASQSKDALPLLECADAWLLRGSLLSERGDYAAAINDLTKAMALKHADVATIKRVRGFAYLKTLRYDEALADMNEALRLAPEDGVALNNRGVVLRELGRIDEAKQDFLRAIALAPDLPNPRDHLAKLEEACQLIEATC